MHKAAQQIGSAGGLLGSAGGFQLGSAGGFQQR
jgi:hypothetical protein